MARALVRTLLAVLAGLPAASAVAQVDRGRTAGATTAVGGDPARGVQRASCVLQLDVDPSRSGVRPTDTQTLNALLTSTALVDAAAQKALGLAPDVWPKVAQVELVPAGTAAVRLGVSVTRNPDVKLPENAAQALLDELTARAKAAVEQVGARQEQAAAERVAGLEKEQAAARERLEGVSAQLRASRGAGEYDADPRLSGRSLVAERQQLEATMAGQRARLRVIEEELRRRSETAATRPAAGTTWLELIAARERLARAVRAEHEKGKRTEVEVLEAEAKVAEARAMAAADSRAEARNDPRGFDAGERWQNEAVTIRATLAESEVRAALLTERAARATTQPVPDLDRLRQDEMAARQALSEVTNQIEQVRRERRGGGGGVRLLILDGKVRP